MNKIKRFFAAVHRGTEDIFLLPVRLYRKYFSSLKRNPTCRFTPTCSEYAILAVREWGIIIGALMALWRVVRCNPFSRGGDDYPPQNPMKKHSDINDSTEN